MNSLTKEEKSIVTRLLMDFINSRYSLQQYEEYIQSNFSDICKKNEMNRFLNIANDFYMDDDAYTNFREHSSLNNLDEYIKNNYKKILFINDDLNCVYHFKMNNSNIRQENFVKNGTLIIEIHRIIDYNTNIIERLMMIKKLDKYLKEIEKKLSTILYVKVRIIYNDIIIPPK